MLRSGRHGISVDASIRASDDGGPRPQGAAAGSPGTRRSAAPAAALGADRGGRSHWAEVEACAGRAGDFARVRWYIVEGRSNFEHRGRTVIAYGWPSHAVVIAGRFVSHGAIVRHELLHDLLDTGSHLPEYFDRRYGPIVN